MPNATDQTPTAAASDGASTNLQARRHAGGRPAVGPSDPCARCGGPGAKLPKRRFCAECEQAYRHEASAWQERDYLHAYLHTRGNESDRQVERLRESARAQGIDWKKPAPKPMHFDARMAALTDRPKQQPKTKVKQKETAA